MTPGSGAGEPEVEVDTQKLVWPAVVAFVAALAAVVVILVVVPSSNASAQQAVVTILGMLGSALGSIFVLAHVRAVRKDVKEVKEQVNGRMTQMVDALAASTPAPTPETPKETAP